MSNDKQKAIIVDLDGTLCDSSHRKHFVETDGKKDWNKFYDGMVDDPINQWCYDIISTVGYYIIFVTGRPSKYRKMTYDWLKKHTIYDSSNSILLMRPNENFEKDSIIKERLYKEEIKPRFDIQFCIDDRKQVVDMWRSNGLVCLQCAEGNF